MPRPLTRNSAGRRSNFIPLFVGLTMLAVCVLGLYQPAARAATTFTVNTTGDGADSNTSDGVCNDGSGNCSLRAAIQQANATAGTDTINFSVTGTINLTGALPDITGNVNINGPGSGLLTVRRDTGGFYRIFFFNGFVVSISGLTVSNGRTPDGTASTSTSGGPGNAGGGIYGVGSLTLSDVVVKGNRTGNGGVGFFGGGGGPGAGIYFSGNPFNGALTMLN